MSDSEHLPTPPTGDAAESHVIESNTPESASETVLFFPAKESARPSARLFSPGTQLKHYIIKKHVGGGGMGQVYLATDTALDRNVAVKVLTQQRGSDAGAIARFMNEARSAARLNHEHIAQVYFAGEEAGIPFIAFEYVEGTNIREMVEKHDVFPLPQAINYLLQISHALAHVAAHGVIHRDVKPSNILITRQGQAKLIDMGLSRLLDTTEAQGDLTASGVTLGTFDYISPEQARDPRNTDIRSDIYSLGCTFFFMLAGRPPFPEGTVLQKLLQHQGDAPPDIRSFQPSIPAEIAFIIQKMMAKSPKQRYQTPTVLIDALTEATRRLGLRPASQGDLVWSPVRSRRKSLLHHIPWIASVLLLFIGFFLMTLYSRWFPPLKLPDISATQPFHSPPSPVPNTSVAVPDRLPSSSFEAVFLPHRAAEGFAPSVTGGGLLPASAEHVRTLGHVQSGRYSVADLPTAVPRTTDQPSRRYSPVLCVDPAGNTAGSYPSLSAAMTDAGDGAVIELMWNGVLRVEEPIRMDRRRLTITASKGYEPILFFEQGIQNIRSFFTVFSSEVTFQHIGIEVQFSPNVVLLYWSLFGITGNSQLTFDHCCLTIRNKSVLGDTAHFDDVVFFRVGMTPDAEETGLTEEPYSDLVSITMTDSLVRGEAVAIQSHASQDIHADLTNTLLALAKPFLLTKNRYSLSPPPIHIRWDKVAFLGRDGLLSLFDSTAASPIVVHVDSQQSIFILNDSPFVVFHGVTSFPSVLSNLQWSVMPGEVNYFQGVLGPRLRSSVLGSSGNIEDMPLSEWQKLSWSDEAVNQTVENRLSLSKADKPMSRYVPLDIRVLSDPTGRAQLPDLTGLPKRFYNE